MGYFIGSPGMNFLPARWQGAALDIAGQRVPVDGASGPTLDGAALAAAGDLTLGIRPEYVTLGQPGEPGVVEAEVLTSQDVGTYGLVATRVGASIVRARLAPGQPLPANGSRVGLRLLSPRSCFYQDGRLMAFTQDKVGA